MQRPRRPPEVVQSSALDCGPAALSSLLRGLGGPGSYEPLRDLCATDVDGTSIDSIERVARAAGAHADQLVVPAEHVLALPEEYLPAIVVTVLPDGFTHFVVLWRLGRTSATVMDPAIGLRRLSRSQLMTELYRHPAPVSAGGWREWAGSEVFTTALRRRMDRVGVDSNRIDELIDAATSDRGIEGLARLDGAIRRAESGSERGRDIEPDRPVEVEHRSCVPIADEPDQVTLHGAVLLRARTWSENEAEPSLLERLSAPDPGPWEALTGRVPRWRSGVVVVALGALALAAGFVAEEVVARRAIDGAARLTFAPVLLVGLLVALVAVGASWAATATGRRIERALRRAWWDAAASLPASFVRSRPASDLADRGHLLHRLRELPLHLLQTVFAVGLVVCAAFAIVVMAPATALAVVALSLGAIAMPLGAARRAGDLDHRVRTLSGSLSRFVVDAVLGVHVSRDGRTADSLRIEHDSGLAAWRLASRHQVDMTVVVQGVTAIVTAAGAAWVVAAASSASAGVVLFAAAAALLIVDAGVLLAERVRLAPTVRSVAARAAGPLQAAADARPAGRQGDPGEDGKVDCGGPPRLRLEKVRTVVGSITVLDGIDLEVTPGEHVAVVGRSGSGKSTLLDVVLGIIDPDEGRIVGAPSPGDRSVVWSAGTTRIWNDTLDVNLGGTSTTPSKAAQQRLAAFDAGDLAEALGRRGDIRLGDAGGRLSEGEAQRVRLARAAGRPDARFVVLDEAFRGLTRERRSALLRRARNLWRDATLLCATHDIHDTLDFDRVVVLDGGALIEVGDPRQLASETGSAYAQLLACEGPPLTGWQHIELGSPSTAIVAERVGLSPAPSGSSDRKQKSSMTGPNRQRSALAVWAASSILLTLVSVGMVVVAFREIGQAALDNRASDGVVAFGVGLGFAGLAGSSAAWCNGHLALALGERCRRWSLEHALNIDPDQARGLGVGRALGWSIDVDLISTALLGASTAAVLGAGELAAVVVISEASGRTSVQIVVAVAVGVLAALTFASARARFQWTAVRTELTGRLVERIAGIETTRLQSDERGTSAEGRRFTNAVDETGGRMDRLAVGATAVPAITTAILLTFSVGTDDAAASAVLVGLALLAGMALQRTSFACSEIVSVLDAHRGLRTLVQLRSERHQQPRGEDFDGESPVAAVSGGRLLHVHQATARHRDGAGLGSPVDLALDVGARVLISGPSGCGKTTLGQLLSDERTPTSGSVWRRPGIRTVRVPQGADAHLFQASLAFNLLAPIAWPPTAEDLDRAEALLVELGLDDLLSRMPVGLSQPVGDGGWRLSSGERSRIALARGLLQRPDVLILDETIAPLDGVARILVLEAATRHSASTVLIAHP